MVRKPITILAIALLCAFTFAHSYDEDYHDNSVVKSSYKPKCDSLKKHHKYEKEEHKYEKEEDKHEKKEEHKYEKEEDKHEKKEEHKYEKEDDKHEKKEEYKYEKEDDKHEKKEEYKYEKEDDKHEKKEEHKYEKEDDKHEKKEEYKYEKEEDKHEKKEEHKYKKEEDKHEKKEEHKYEKKDYKKKFVYGKKCMFKFCDGKRVVYVGKNDKALTSAICSKKYGVKIGSVDETGEAYLVQYKRIRISKWKPYGLKQSFAPSFFKAYTKHGKNASGVGHEVAQQNQAKFLNKKCWILPLKAYQVWDKKTGGWVEKYGKDPYVDCISFCTLIKKPYY